MSIKTIDRSTISDGRGLQKKINKSAEKMVFDILQATQYSTPIPSTVRELVTNACDSQREKEIAIEILKGHKKVEDYYITRNEDEYKDSNFKRDYYDLNYLDPFHNNVEITYKYGEGSGYCDLFEVKDYGVGVGGDRLKGILELGYSTKRNTSENFGAFGLGAKVALSTNVPYYTIDTCHNGKRFLMNCLPYKTNFLINKFEADGSIDIAGETVYYQSVDTPNTTTVSFGVKRHNRQRFIDTIQEQLVYLDNVNLTIDDGEHSRPYSFRASILYNSDNLIVSDSGWYAKPHIVIVKSKSSATGINYGHIDFRELEMEQLYGSVGLKCPIRQSYKSESGEEVVIQEGVDVTPSREKVIWNENTKKFIQELIDKAAEEATALVENQLVEKDFLLWISKCRDVLVSSATYSSALYHISRIIDTQKIAPKYTLNPSIHYKPPKIMLPGFNVRKVTATIEDKKYSIKSEEVSSWGDVNLNNVYFLSGNRSRIKDYYIIETEGVFYTISTKSTDALEEKLIQTVDPTEKKLIQSRISKIKNNWGVLNYIKNSQLYNDYEEIEVPEDYESKLKEKELEVENSEKFTNLSPAERRKLQERIVAFSLRFKGDYEYSHDLESFVWDKVEPKLSDVMSSDTLTYYGTSDDKEALLFAGLLMKNMTPIARDVFPGTWVNSSVYRYSGTHYPMYYRDEIPTYLKERGFDNSDIVINKFKSVPQILRVSSSNIKYIESNDNCKHINEFFLTLTNSGGYTMDPKLIRWCTGSQVGELPTWIDGLRDIDPRFGELYRTLHEYKHDHFHPQLSNSETKDVIAKELYDTMKRMIEFKKYEQSLDDDSESKEELLSKKSRELFTLDIPEVECFDNDIIELINLKNDIMENIHPFMSAINFSSVYRSDRDSFLQELRSYLKLNGKLDIEFPETLTTTKTEDK